MKTFKKMAAQGDVMFMRVNALPKAARLKFSAETGAVIVAHSETGHHHSFAKDSGVTLFDVGDPLVCYLRCESAQSLLEHHRPYDTHETIAFGPGTYKVIRQREWTPEGWRRVED